MLDDLKVFHKTYEFMKWLHSLLNKFPKSEKYTMAQKIENTTLNVLEGIIQSNNEFDKTASLKKTIVELDKLRIFFRMSKDLQMISFSQYEFGIRQIDEIGRMLGGMLKKFSNFEQGKEKKLERRNIPIKNTWISSESAENIACKDITSPLIDLEKEKGSNGMAEPNQLITSYEIYNKLKYINVYDNKKENDAKNVASKVMQILTDYNEKNNNSYINLSVDNSVGVAPVALMVMHQSNKLGPHRLSGSIPDWGAPALSIIDNLSIQNMIQYDKFNFIVLTKDWAESIFVCGAVKRGGNWNNGADAGPFAVNLNNAPGNTNTNIGFRCCSRPKSQIFCFYGNNEQCNGTTLIQIQAVFQLNINLRVSAISKMKQLLIEPCRNFNDTFIYFNEDILFVKTYKNLFDNVISLENIYNSYLKARLCKNNRKEVLEFSYNLEKELLILQEELTTQNYATGNYRNFTIYEPKKREISALPFRDRVVHHAIYAILNPIFDKGFIFDSYACRKNKGTYAGIQRLHKFLVKGDFYALKCDVKKYFPSVNHEVLKNIIKQKILDKKLLRLINLIIDSREGDNGIPIGNLTSQLFANIYLNELDYFIKHELKVKFYLRYMDDFIILDEDKKTLYEYKIKISLFLENIGLVLHEKKCRIFPVQNGIDFLGYVIFRNYILVRKKTVKRALVKINKKIKNYDLEKIDFEKLMNSFNSWEAYMNHADTYRLKNSLMGRFKNVM